MSPKSIKYNKDEIRGAPKVWNGMVKILRNSLSKIPIQGRKAEIFFSIIFDSYQIIIQQEHGELIKN
jgi:hypothetical protein